MRDFELQFSAKLITPWGGMALIKRMLDHLGFDRALLSAGLPLPGSNPVSANDEPTPTRP